MNQQIILTSRPKGKPTKDNFKIVRTPERPPKKNEVMCRTIYLSLDPYMRGRMDESKSYAKPVKIGNVMEAGAVSQVIKSASKLFKEGDYVEGRTGWQDMPTVNANILRKLNPKKAPISTALGILGMPGTTAYVGMMNIAKPKTHETLVVGAASGAVGATVGQIGKILGCHVVGIAGTSEKCSYVTQHYGFDFCINRRSKDFHSQLSAACPKGVDIYWENVGGGTFDTVFPLLNDFARIPVCGLISRYNAKGVPKGPNQLPLLFRQILTKRLLIQGFIVFDFDHQRIEALDQLASWIEGGKMHYKEHFIDGLENAPNAFLGLLSGKNFGKLIIRVSNDPTV